MRSPVQRSTRDPMTEALAREGRSDRAWFYWLIFLLYTGLLAWSAYDLGARETGAGLICEPPATVERPSGRVP